MPSSKSSTANGASAPAHSIAVKKILGDAGTVELVGILGYYAMVSMTLNTFKAPLPQGTPAPFAEPK